VASDLHLEFIKRRFLGERVIKPLLDADLLVLAGDIDIGLGALDAFDNWPVPILYVIGNHESYGRVYDEDREAPRGLGSIRHVEEMYFENTKFDGRLLIELPSPKLLAR